MSSTFPCSLLCCVCARVHTHKHALHARMREKNTHLEAHGGGTLEEMKREERKGKGEVRRARTGEKPVARARERRDEGGAPVESMRRVEYGFNVFYVRMRVSDLSHIQAVCGKGRAVRP